MRLSYKLPPYSSLSLNGVFGAWVFLIFLVGLGYGQETPANSEGIGLSHLDGAGWTLELKGAPLAEAFTTLTKTMGVPVVSAPPPDGALTLRCSGSDIQAILSCLLGSGASVMYRRGLPGNPDGIASVRILASSFERVPARAANADPARIASILEMTRSQDPDVRADGFIQLAQVGQGNETIQWSAFHQGLSDTSGEVRAAALLGLNGVDPKGSREDMMSGLQDADGNVRLAALDVLGEGPGAVSILKQGLNDSDELVRELARLRLGLPEQNPGEIPSL